MFSLMKMTVPSLAHSWMLLLHFGWIIFEYPVNGVTVTFGLRVILADNQPMVHLLSVSFRKEGLDLAGGMMFQFLDVLDD